MRLIVTCGCSDTTQFAKDAFRIWFPKDEIDKVVEKPDRRYLQAINNYILLNKQRAIDFDKPYALLLDSGKYNRTDNVRIYNLLKGYRIC